ncbi:MAG: DNA recombination protein RmuC [Candidatus Paceibacterota bacterium]
MELISLIVAVIVGALVGGVVFWLLGSREKGSETSFALLEQQLKNLQDTTHAMEQKMGESTRHMHDSVARQFSESQKVIRDTNEQMVRHLTEVAQGVSETRESSKQVFTIAEQLKNLEKVLLHQKQRGSLGEASLELVLSNILPATAYKLQYQFKDGTVVDAVILTKEGIIPVDAKFSLDNYNRITAEEKKDARKVLEKEFKNDLKKRIDETAKYIKPNEGTLPFAIMYIPAEGIYYDLLVNEVGAVKVNTRSLIDYAYTDKNVIIVSPTTFSAYLQSVLYGFRAFKIEESAKEIGKRVEMLLRHMKQYNEYFYKVGNSLGTTVNHYRAANKELGKIDKDVLKITGEGMDVEHITLDKPDNED